jgi:type IV secretion system protein VirD4
MSRSPYDDGWGPSHQYRPPPGRHGRWLKLGAFGSFVLAFELWAHRFASPGGHAAAWTLHTLGLLALGLGGLFLLLRSGFASRLSLLAPRPRAPQPDGGAIVERDGVRAHALRLGGGAYLGVSRGRWVLADPEHAVLVLGPPRSGKTTAVVIPTLLACPGPALCTSTKPDVLRATLRARSALGEVWLFDPCGALCAWPSGVRRLCWSPVAAAGSWDDALLMARAMAAATSPGRGTTSEGHWRERSTALLAPLLHAACLSERPVSEVLRWVLRQDLDAPARVLGAHDADTASDVLVGIARTDERERSSIFSATAGVLSAYNADATRRSAAHPNFDPGRFVASTDTLYITAPAHRQALAAPLIVGLLEQLRVAVFSHAAAGGGGGGSIGPPMLWCLDEVANIAPIHDLPALVSEAGGQRLHILACLQDLSQARTRWGPHAADGFLSLFQTKLLLSGIADTRTLESVSLLLGEYDRHLISHTLGRSRPHELLAPHTDSESVTYHTQRHRTLTPGEIHRLPPGHALLLHGSLWGLTRLTPWFCAEPWASLGGEGSGRGLPGGGPGGLALGSSPAQVSSGSSGVRAVV